MGSVHIQLLLVLSASNEGKGKSTVLSVNIKITLLPVAELMLICLSQFSNN